MTSFYTTKCCHLALLSWLTSRQLLLLRLCSLHVNLSELLLTFTGQLTASKHCITLCMINFMCCYLMLLIPLFQNVNSMLQTVENDNKQKINNLFYKLCQVSDETGTFAHALGRGCLLTKWQHFSA